MSDLIETGSPDPPTLRIVWFGESIVSDWENPVATTNRAVIRALGRAGHEVMFHEQRNNRPMVEAMRSRGSAIYRAFQTSFPDVAYRTYDLPSRAIERSVWMARETATADAVIVQDDAPAEVLDWLNRFSAPGIVTLFLRTSPEPMASEPNADLVLAPVSGDGDLLYGPAVLAQKADANLPRSGSLTVAYSELAESEQPAVSCGPGNPVLTFVPEALLPDHYAKLARATIVDRDPSPFASARAYLAVAHGVEQVISTNDEGPPALITEFADAATQAALLIASVRNVLANR